MRKVSLMRTLIEQASLLVGMDYLPYGHDLALEINDRFDCASPCGRADRRRDRRGSRFAHREALPRRERSDDRIPSSLPPGRKAPASQRTKKSAWRT